MLLCTFVVALAACSDDPETAPPETTVPDTTTAVMLDTTTTTAGVQVDTTAPTTTAPTLPDEEFPGPTVLAYLEQVRNIAVATGQMAQDMRAANNDWDNRSVTGVTFPETEAALVDIRDRARELRDAIGLVEPPTEFGLPVEHQTAWVASGEMADAAVEALAGLRSPDTGERRRAALSDFIVSFERFSAAVGRIVDIVDVGAAIDLPTVTVATTAATTTTTTTTAVTTTTPTSATTATTGATTTTVPASTTTTLPAVVEYSIVDSGGDSSDPVQLWLTVSVEVGTTKDQLARLATRLATEYRLSREYQALVIHFVRFPEGIATLGRWTDAPHGDWERAGEATKGDYSTHQIVDETIEKDWSLLPTDEQMDVYRRYRDFQTAYQVENNVDPPASELIPLAAAALGLEEAAIEDAIDAWSAWVGY